MNNVHKIIVLLLLLLSVISFIAAIVSFVRQLKNNKHKSIAQKLTSPILLLLLSVFTLRCIISVEAVIGNDGLNCFEAILNSLVLTLQTFSLDEEYKDAITIGKNIFLLKFSHNFFSGFLSFFYGFLSAITNICAPILGGAIILGVLTNFFPRLKLRIFSSREKYVFSELNERAIYLAEDIIREKEKEHKCFPKLPIIVFTDAYISKDDEPGSELIQRAKELNAVIIRDDIKYCDFSKTEKLHYILIDEKDMDNIHTFNFLISDNKRKTEYSIPVRKRDRYPYQLDHLNNGR